MDSGHQNAREEDLGHQVAVGHQRPRRPGDDAVEQVPGQQAGEHEDQVGDASAGQMGHPVEDQGEDGRGQQGLEDHPDHAESGLAVAEGHIAGTEPVEHLAALPQLRQLGKRELAGWGDDDVGHGSSALRVVELGEDDAPVGAVGGGWMRVGADR